MEFTDREIHFLNEAIAKSIREEERFLKGMTDLAQKENDIGQKRNYNRSIEYCIKRIEELEALRDKINE